MVGVTRPARDTKPVDAESRRARNRIKLWKANPAGRPRGANKRCPTRLRPPAEAVSLIEPVRFAATQRTHADGDTVRVGIGKYLPKHGCPDALPLMLGHDVQMLQEPGILLRAKRDKAHPDTTGFDEAAERRIKGRQETIPRAVRVKTSSALQALAHCRDANGDQDIRIRSRGGQENQIHAKAPPCRLRDQGTALTSPLSSSPSASPASQRPAAPACPRSRRGAPR